MDQRVALKSVGTVKSVGEETLLWLIYWIKTWELCLKVAWKLTFEGTVHWLVVTSWLDRNLGGISLGLKGILDLLRKRGPKGDQNQVLRRFEVAWHTALICVKKVSPALTGSEITIHRELCLPKFFRDKELFRPCW